MLFSVSSILSSSHSLSPPLQSRCFQHSHQLRVKGMVYSPFTIRIWEVATEPYGWVFHLHHRLNLRMEGTRHEDCWGLGEERICQRKLKVRHTSEVTRKHKTEVIRKSIFLVHLQSSCLFKFLIYKMLKLEIGDCATTYDVLLVLFTLTHSFAFEMFI